MAEALASVGADPTEPQELSRRFKLDKTLTWRISRVIREEDAWEAVAHIPGRPSIKALVERLQSSGASPESVQAVWQAMEGFERFVEVHSGDRETLDIMVGVGNRPSTTKRLEAFRKQGFQAASAAWGVQARVQACAHLMLPSREPEMVDIATFSALVDLRRLRPNTPWTIAAATAWEGQSPEVDAQAEPLFPEAVWDGVPIVPEFCSRPLSHLRVKTTPGGSKRYEITEGPLGHTGAITVVVAWKWRKPASIYATAEEDCGEHGTHLSTPAELMIHDLFVHRSIGFPMPPSGATYSDLPGGPKYPTEGQEVGRMPMPEEVSYLGSNPPNTTVLEIPRYTDLVECMVKRLGYPLTEFAAYRHRVKYPTIPTLAILRHPLIQRARSG